MSLHTLIATSPAYLSLVICVFSIFYLAITRQPTHNKARIKKLTPKFNQYDTTVRRWIFLVLILGLFAGLLVSLAFGTYTAFPVVFPLSALVIFDAVLSLVTGIHSAGWEKYVFDKTGSLRWLAKTEIALALAGIAYCCLVYFVILK
ncbi:hypothetical protein hrd7_30490 [Leptolinea sp. HRD-7]|nr:hypothetical protein hrd7_30490 [Leptolinea sp. HRD-7]